MNTLYNKSLLKTAIATLLLTFMSNSSFSYESIIDGDMNDYDYSYYDQEEKSGNLYMRFNYSGVSPGISSFSAKEDASGIKTQKIFSLDGNEKLQEGYNPEYKGGFAGNAAIGYKARNFRVELEGLTSSAATDNKQVELQNPRGSMINFDDIDKDSYSFIKIFKNDDKKEVFSGNEDKFQQFELEEEYKELIGGNFKITDEGFQNKAAMINAYYDIDNGSNFTPYFGVGAGLANVKFFGVSQIKPAMQGKLGLNYNLSDKIQLSAGYRYFTALGNSSFSGVKLDNEIHGLSYKVEDIYNDQVLKEVDLPGSTTATVGSKFANHSLELGLTFNF